MASAEPTLSFERELMDKLGGPLICLDEVGRGAIAGPVMVGAVLLTPATQAVAGVKDSKLLSAAKREQLAPILHAHLPTAVGSASAEEIDALGIISSLRLAGRRALRQLEDALPANAQPRGILLDGSHDWLTDPDPDLLAAVWEQEEQQLGSAEAQQGLSTEHRSMGSRAELPVTTLIKADMSCWGVAAASVVAKVERDAYMQQAHEGFPAYGFSQHKGYGTRAHQQALTASGPSPEHRLTWLKS